MCFEISTIINIWPVRITCLVIHLWLWSSLHSVLAVTIRAVRIFGVDRCITGIRRHFAAYCIWKYSLEIKYFCHLFAAVHLKWTGLLSSWLCPLLHSVGHDLDTLTRLTGHDLDTLTRLMGHDLDTLTRLMGLNLDTLTFSRHPVAQGFEPKKLFWGWNNLKMNFSLCS